MRYLLDTNVVSDSTKPRPNPRVTRWMGGLPPEHCALSTITVGEIQKGASKLEPGAKRTYLIRWLEEIPTEYRKRVLPVDVPIARAWGRIADEARRAGRELSVPDGILVATATIHKMVLVTRNERDFRDRGVQILNPWNR
jgi:predicted nucleic acid-binding protein